MVLADQLALTNALNSGIEKAVKRFNLIGVKPLSTAPHMRVNMVSLGGSLRSITNIDAELNKGSMVIIFNKREQEKSGQLEGSNGRFHSQGQLVSKQYLQKIVNNPSFDIYVIYLKFHG